MTSFMDRIRAAMLKAVPVFMVAAMLVVVGFVGYVAITGYNANQSTYARVTGTVVSVNGVGQMPPSPLVVPVVPPPPHDDVIIKYIYPLPDHVHYATDSILSSYGLAFGDLVCVQVHKSDGSYVEFVDKGRC